VGYAGPVVTALGEFEVGGVLGEGGSGIVYDAAWGPRRVALKVLHAALLDTASARSQFLAEAKRLQAVSHASVVKVLAAGELPDGRPYLAMERLDGETLAAVIQRAPLPLATALGLFGELCDAVAALHAQGLVHRDLKPENVYVVAGKHAVLLDFGIAKDVAAPASTTTQQGNIRGTPAYMAPERFFGQPAGTATDIYELAVTLYAMLAGKLPWADVADPESRLQPSPLDGVPRALDVEVRRALSTRAQNRPATPAAFLAAVRTAAASDAGPAPNETARMRSADNGAKVLESAQTPLGWAPTAKAERPPRAHRRGIVFGLGAVLAGGVVGAVVWRWHGAAPTLEVPAATIESPDLSGSAAPAEPPGSAGARSVAIATAPHAGSAATDDPWAGDIPASPTTSPAAPLFALVSPAPTRDAARHAAAAAIVQLPETSRIVGVVQLAELRADPHFAHILENLAKDSRVEALVTVAPACAIEALATATWIAVGAPSLDGATGATAIVEGRWQRADVERCLDHDRSTTRSGDAAHAAFKLGGLATLAFIDDHHFTLTTRDDAPEPHRERRHGDFALAVTTLAQDAALVVSINGAGQHWPGEVLPANTSLRGWLRPTTDGARFEVLVDPHDVAAAIALEHSARAQVDAAFARGQGDTSSHIDVVRSEAIVTMRGELGDQLLDRIAASAN
jgi:predicted Ser/Thr protein kinase